MRKNQIKVFYQEGDDPFIYAVNGSFTIPQLEEIEKELNVSEYRELFREDGEYLMNVYWNPSQTDEYGRVEVPGYWEFDVVQISRPWLEDKK